MSVQSILSDIGHAIEKVFTGAVKVAQVAEPFIDVAFPGVASLYNATVNEVANAEVISIAANAQTGSGAQKLTIAVANITPTFLTYAKQNGINVSPTTITNWVTAVVATLNNIPVPNQPVAPVAASTAIPAPSSAPQV